MKIQDRGHTGNEGNEDSRPGHTGNEGNEDSRQGTHRERRERWRLGHFDWLKRIAEVLTFRIVSTFRRCRNVSSSVETSLSEVLTFREIPNGFRPTTLKLTEERNEFKCKKKKGKITIYFSI